MTVLYLDLGMGAAGDMFAAALLELMPNRRDEFLKIMNSLGLPGVQVSAAPSLKCGISGTHLSVSVHGVSEHSLDVDEIDAGADHHVHPGRVWDHSHAGDGHGEDPHLHQSSAGRHQHTHFPDVVETVNRLDIPEQARTDAIAVYTLLADAEASVHAMPVDQVHFHEVGEADAIADIVGTSLLMSWLRPQRVLASPVNVGSGKVRCAHGIVPVPAPATERLLRGVPVYAGAERGELCTPTGAALLKHFVDEFVPTMPPLTLQAAGYGMGTKDFETANCLRMLWGDTPTSGAADDVFELSCNLDDMTGEAIAHAQHELFAAGALEVFTIAAGMKKGRPGVVLTCLCTASMRDELVSAIFRHTTTLGIREHQCHRFTLDRAEETVISPYGEVHVKVASGYGVRRAKAEYADLAAIAAREGLALSEVARNVPLPGNQDT